MKISTLEMIHETLKNEYEMARVNYADALKEKCILMIIYISCI